MPSVRPSQKHIVLSGFLLHDMFSIHVESPLDYPTVPTPTFRKAALEALTMVSGVICLLCHNLSLTMV